MRLGELGRLVRQSIRRNRRDFLLSSIGIVVGISTLLFFTALGTGVKEVVLERVFVIDQLEVVPKRFEMAGMRGDNPFGGEALDDDTVEKLEEIEGVREVYPKMQLTFPSSARGGEGLIGQNLVTELVADGIPEDLVDDEELDGKLAFRDYEAEISCGGEGDCPDGHTCADSVCEPRECSAADDSACTGKSYCHEDFDECRMPIPVVASPQMLELYNSGFQTAMGGASGQLSKLPELSEDALIGFRFEGVFGQSYVGRAAKGEKIDYRMEFVGFTDKAIELGATIPIGYVKRLNERFGSEEDASTYHSIVVETTSNEMVSPVAERIEEMNLNLSDRHEDARRAGLLITLLTLVFNLIGLIILIISAVNIMNTFLMIILERRRELGLMRAVGARKADIRWLVLAEASVIGLIAGAVGLAAGFGLIAGADYLFANAVGDFPFKPDSLFVVEWWMLAAGLAVAVVFCWLGALFPALQASHIDPARTLSGE
ncbi:MAG: ABC transporter permease [Persicimonas sp.]